MKRQIISTRTDMFVMCAWYDEIGERGVFPSDDRDAARGHSGLHPHPCFHYQVCFVCVSVYVCVCVFVCV
jgi:hypothetical protein